MKTTLLLCLALLGMTSLALADKTVKYPKAEPVFSITAPEGWETNWEEGK
ncbi:MAG: hypothetical protein JNG86_13770, partial [Verrucomicrobiaceae bacterium]|nr:hypothetical protein [Verrucomicrobiaceae bacterium]